MFRILLLSSFMLLNACTSLQTPPMKSSDINALRSGKTAVMFYDVAGQIVYQEDTYQVLAITTSTTQASYKGFWDINKDMSGIHANNLRGFGVNAESAYKKFAPKEIQSLKSEQKNMLEQLHKSYNEDLKTNIDILNANLRKSLVKKGYDYLVWVPFKGYSLHVRTLGLAPLEQSFMNYTIFDLKHNKLMWKGVFSSYTTIDLKGKTSKDFLERSNLRGYKSRLKTLTHLIYAEKGHGQIGVSLGFVKPN